MGLEQDVMSKLKDAMKAKDHARLLTLRAIKAKILEFKTAAGAKDVLSPDDELDLVEKMVKQRRDSLKIYEEQKREDLAEQERAELTILEEFLPAQLSEEEVSAKITEIISKTGAASIKDMGKVMGMATKELKGKAEGSLIARLVKSALQ